MSKKIQVTPGGWIELCNTYGDDQTIIESARISYAASEAADPLTFIKKLMKNEHWSPFEMVEMRFRVRVPMDTWRQWIRHRTANVNEVSTRYTEIDTSRPLEQLCNVPVLRADREFDLEAVKYRNDVTAFLLRDVFSYYDNLLKAGVQREIARSVLPLCTYTEAFWKIDLRNLIHFLQLRLDNHAQGTPGGIREYAKAVHTLMCGAFPLVGQAFDSLYMEDKIE